MIREFKAGDTVSVRSSWGSAPERDTKLLRMERTPKEHMKYGEPVDKILWDEDNNQWVFPFVATLEDSSWAYNYQVKPHADFWKSEPEWYGERKL